MKIVFDTSVLLAAFGTHGLCESLFAACAHAHEIVLSEYILTELDKHLSTKFKVSKDRAREIITFLRENVTIVEPAKIGSRRCRDAKDLPILGTAVAATADAIVSGDKDLLTIKIFEKIPILTPRQLYDLITAKPDE